MAIAIGHIVLVQESRFRLVTSEGRAMLFLMSRNAPFGPQGLPSLIGAGQVLVEHKAAEGLVARIATRIVLMSQRPEPASRAKPAILKEERP